MNLLEETVKELEYENRTPTDVKWCGLGDCWFSWEDFVALSDFEYDDGYGGTEIDMSLVIVGEDFWLERSMSENDGSEWWVFKSFPIKPQTHRAPSKLTKY